MSIFYYLFLIFFMAPFFVRAEPAPSIHRAQTALAKSLACEHQNQNLFDLIREFLIVDAGAQLPSEKDFSKEVLLSLQMNSRLEEQPLLAQGIKKLISIWYRGMPKQIKTKGEFLLYISHLESGSPWGEGLNARAMNRARYQQRMVFKNLKTQLSTRLSCRDSEGEVQFLNRKKDSKLKPFQATPVNQSANYVFQVAYQSCLPEVLTPLSEDTEPLKGLAIIGNHPDGVGKKRRIANLQMVQQTHPYLASQNENSYPPPSCFNVYKEPLVYDYGGKPFASSQDPLLLDLFKDAGGGTSTLGIDCSGFVVASLLNAGRRLSPNRMIQGTDVYAFNSNSFINPSSSGLGCFERIKQGYSQSQDEYLDIRSGDILAVSGHILILDDVNEEDPWGFIESGEACKNLKISKFNFSVIQSSPSKNGVGINRFKIQDYLIDANSPKLSRAFTSYAEHACENYYNQKVKRLTATDFSIVRHLGTPACLGERVKLQNESCIRSCRLTEYQSRNLR